jgi:hypothetical protein
MALITPSLAEAAITYQNAVGGGDTYAPGLRLHVRNGGVGSITVTLTAYGACSQGFLHNKTITVPAGEDRFINPPNVDRFQSPTDGLIHVGYSGVTTVTVGAIA